MKAVTLQKKGLPLYIQVEHILGSQIMTGELLLGKRMPTEKELVKTYQVSSITGRPFCVWWRRGSCCLNRIKAS